MYNKLFTKILDSSIWLESAPTRLVWLTMIAAMDEDGFAQFASIGNLSHRARVSAKDAEAAIACLEGPDPNSSDPENEGRRIERVPGGWMILNSAKYRDLVRRVVIQEQTRKRVAKHRAEKRTCNADVTLANEAVTPSRADTDTRAEGEGWPSLAIFSGLVLAIDKDVPAYFINSKYFGKLEKCDGHIKNPQYFAGQVVSWWKQNGAEKAAANPKPKIKMV